MKKYIINGILILVASMFILNSCVKDTDYETPQISCDFDEASLTGNNVDIKTAILYWFSACDTNDDGEINPDDGEVESPYFFGNDNTDYISGYVTSSDQTGNFYKELFLQDNSIDPEAAIKVSINFRDLYTKYEPGRKIYIYLKGLSLGKNQSGELVLTEGDEQSMDDYIRENVAKANIKRNCEAVAITPLSLESPLVVNDSHLGKYVQFSNVQFHYTELGKNFVDPLDSYDTHLVINSCDDYSTILLETSTYASFKNNPIPEGMGSVEGILTRDYEDEVYVLRVNSPDSFSFDDTRCDPGCTYADAQGTTNLFSDDFESQAAYSLISGNGWTNYIEEGTKGWIAYPDSYNDPNLGLSARMGSYNSGDTSSIAWLIMPAIDFDAQEGETLVFKTSNSFSDGSTLQLYKSTDWDGTEANITSATWEAYPVGYIVQDDDYYTEWFDAGIIDLSCEEGVTYFAFKYVGSGNEDFDGSYEIDEIYIDYTP